MKRILVLCLVSGVLWSVLAWAQPHQTLTQRRNSCRNLCLANNATDQDACLTQCLDLMQRAYGSSKPPHHKKKKTTTNP